MKKFTLALSAMLMVAAVAPAAEPGVTYAVVPADASAQAQGLLLTVNAEGKLGYTNDLSAATNWVYELGEMDENYNLPYYLTNGGKYLQLAETGATMTADKTMTFVGYSEEVEGASVITNTTRFWYPALEVEPCYLNAVTLATEPEQSVASAFFFIEVNENSTLTDVQNEVWKLSHPQALVIAVGGATARTHGKYMAVTDEGRLITTNTLNDNAVWELGWSDENGCEEITNLAVKGYLYQGSESRNITLSQEPVSINIVDSEVLVGAYGITTNMEATPATYSFLNALNTNTDTENGGIGIWNLDEGSSFFFLGYDPSLTAEAIDAKVTDLYDLAKYKSSSLPYLRKLMNASWAGREYGLEEIYAAEGAETQEEYDAAYAAAVQAAVQYAEMSLAEGFVLNSVRLNESIGYFADNETKPYQRQAEAGINCLWKAEIIEDGDTVIDDCNYQTFRLINTVSNTYMGPAPKWSQPQPAETDVEKAAIMRLVPGNNGMQILQLNSPVTNYPAYVNISSNADSPELTMWVYDNDGGNFFTFDKLPAFGEELRTAIEADGEYQTVDQNKVYENIKAIRVCVPVGAQATVLAEVSLSSVVTDDFGFEEETTVLKTWNAEAIAAVEPTTERIGISYYDWDIWDYVTDSIDAVVYTLPLDEEITAVGTYTVNVGEYAFSVKTDDATLFSQPFTQELSIIGYADVPVTPAAGIVEDFTSIAIDPDGLEGWGTNWDYAGENLTVTYNGEIAKDANGNDLSIDTETLNMTYDGMDWETWEGGGWIIPVNFDEEGTYVLTIPEAMLAKEGYFNNATTVEWTVEKKDGIVEITSMKVNGKAYDLQGRPVANPTRGLYIIDGVKTYVK